VPGLFGLEIVDEAHNVRNVKTRAWSSITEALPDRLFLISATPLYSQASDLHGVLSAFEQISSVPLRDDVTEPDFEQLKYLRDCLLDPGTDITNFDPRHYLWNGFLSPKYYRVFMAGAPGSVDVDYATVVPSTLRALIGCRNLSGSMQASYDGTPSIVGGDIPKPVNVLVELQLPDWVDSEYYGAHRKIISTLYRPVEPPAELQTPNTAPAPADGAGPARPKPPAPENKEVRYVRNLRSHRALQTLAAYPVSARVASSRGKLQDTDRWALEPNAGYTSLFVHTRPSHDMLPQATRQLAALQLAAASPVMQALCIILAELVVRRDKKVLIFFHNPFI
jgi:hypothetical protein